jgi:hypothetical protein
MTLLLVRDVLTETFTLGRLSVDGKDFGFTVEDTDRGLDSTDSIEHIRTVKVKGRTAIPAGKYRIQTTYSPKYDRPMPVLVGVPGYQGIRIHSGNDANDTEGCLLPGLTRDVTAGTVGKSRAACVWLYSQISACEANGGEVWIEIVRA